MRLFKQQRDGLSIENTLIVNAATHFYVKKMIWFNKMSS